MRDAMIDIGCRPPAPALVEAPTDRMLPQLPRAQPAPARRVIPRAHLGIRPRRFAIGRVLRAVAARDLLRTARSKAIPHRV